jgi:hypothetical protein
VSPMCGQALADKFKLDYLETSAKSGTNVELVFNLLAESLDLAHKNSQSATQKADIGHIIFYLIYYNIISFANKIILTIYITVLVTRGRHFGARESV